MSNTVQRTSVILDVYSTLSKSLDGSHKPEKPIAEYLRNLDNKWFIAPQPSPEAKGNPLPPLDIHEIKESATVHSRTIHFPVSAPVLPGFRVSTSA